MKAHFSVSSYDRDKALLLQKELNIPHLVARIMVSRGIDTKEKAQYFMGSSLRRDWVNPYEISGMEEVVQALAETIDNHEHIVVFGDFDVDGITATAVLTRGLRKLGAHVTPFIPKRFEEGYGITFKAYERVKKLNPDMIVTVDCGISCADEIDHILQDGVKVIVTDHHEPPEVIPKNIPLVDPRMTPDTPSAILAGVGVALKVVQALGSKKGQPYLWYSLIDFATLGTVADLMPLVGENRALVTEGIASISQSPRPAISALLEECGTKPESVTIQDLSFGVIPRINATGRLGDADAGLNLLLCDNPIDARDYAKRLNEINDERKRIEGELTDVAMEQASHTFRPEDKILIVSGEGWHEGVKGIVASKLVEQYGVPCILFSIDGDEARGSGRTVGNVNLFEAITSASDLVVRYGGHEGAAGITLKTSNLVEFKNRLSEYMKKIPEEELCPAVEVDTIVSLSELNFDTIEELAKLGPFGQKNPTPTFLVMNVCVDNPRLVGQDKKHLSCSLASGASSLSAIKFNHMPHGQDLSNGQIVAASFETMIDEWMGKRKIKARLGSIVTDYQCPALYELMDDSARYLNTLYNSLDNPAGKNSSTHESEKEPADVIKREKLASMSLKELQEYIVGELLQGGLLHTEQEQAIQSLEDNKSTMVVMATGRGKSIIFYIHAIKSALKNKAKSIFIYPLRALISDQSHAIKTVFAQFGLRAEVLNGEVEQEEREKIYSALKQNECDVILTTPEFLDIHIDAFTPYSFDFVVIDEAHHIGMATTDSRPAYKNLSTMLSALGSPTVLAASATLNDDLAKCVREQCRIDAYIFDESSRPNLHVVDMRNKNDRFEELVSLISRGEKTIVYVNSRISTIQIARTLRYRLPQLALMVGFYNAGLENQEKKRIEGLFREGKINVLVATSAFGEGVNIPDVRNVVLFHMPFNEVEFNQMSGRAGRDGKNANVYLFFSNKDAQINMRILEEACPHYNTMVHIYQTCQVLCNANPGKAVSRSTYEKLAKDASTRGWSISEAVMRNALHVFNDLRFINLKEEDVQGNDACLVSFTVNEVKGKTSLTNSVRYKEASLEKEEFNTFKDTIMKASRAELEKKITTPLLPRRFMKEEGYA